MCIIARAKPKSSPAEIAPARLRLRNFRLRAARYRRWATMIEQGRGEVVVRALRAVADALEGGE